MVPVSLKTPDLTPAQLIAVAVGLATQLFNAALISGRVEQLVIGLAGILIPAAWMIADAIIRHGRAIGIHSRLAVPPYTSNGDGSYTRSSDGAVGRFGPHGFHVGAGAGV